MRKLYFALVLFFTSACAVAGSWGAGSFENDAALDWVTECIDSGQASTVASTLDAVLKSKYIEAPDGAAAVVAIEVVAASLGKSGKDLPDDLRLWLERQPKAQIAKLAPLARKVIVRLKDPKLSELKQLWSEGKSNQWSAKIAELEARLGR